MRVKGVALIVGLGLATACSTLEVHTDHDPRANFSEYKTYAWAPESSSKRAADISGVPSELIERRIRSAVDASLSSKGLKLAETPEKADLLVDDHLTQREQVESSGTSVGVGYGGGYGPWGAGIGFPVGNVRQYTQGTLVIDLIDADTKKLVWRGIASDALETPENSQEQINDAVAETLERFPPGAENKKG
ncbi:MAG TPA: DUF4136 domain-containing protein [Bdellovibrionota bacterium]|nr:DUF4136 domain-containing protein [Bdellovibrionota bacterium]